MDQEQQPITFHYWDIKGLAHVILYMLEHLEVPYNWVKYDGHKRPEWIATKMELAKTDFLLPNLPYIEHGDVKLSESRAIHFYIGQISKHSDTFLPTIQQMPQFLQFAGVIDDLYYDATFIGYLSTSEDDYKKRMQEYYEKYTFKIDGLERHVGAITANQWALGENLTILDFYLAVFIEKFLDMEKHGGFDVLGQRPNLVAYLQRFLALERISAFRKTDDFNKAYNNVQAFWGNTA